MTQMAGGSQTSEQTDRRQKAGLWFAAVLVGGFMLFVIIGIAVGGGNAQHDEHHDLESIAQCETQVGKMLKAPATADFDSSTTAAGDSRWTVTGTVDAENSFGATVRASYGCTVVMNDDTATTTVDYFDQ